MPAPLDQKVIDRFAALAGGKPCTQEEAATAVGISERQGRRLLTRPEVQAKGQSGQARPAKRLPARDDGVWLTGLATRTRTRWLAQIPYASPQRLVSVTAL